MASRKPTQPEGEYVIMSELIQTVQLPSAMLIIVSGDTTGPLRRRQASTTSSPSSSSLPSPSSSSSRSPLPFSPPSLSELDSTLSHFSLLQYLHEATGLPTIYFAIALIILLLLVIFQGYGMRFLTHCIGFLYPLYCSLRCLSSTSPSSSPLPPSSAHRLWLIYWMVFGLFSFTERLSDSLLSWLPLYYPLKLSFLLWCFLPQYQGCAVLYDVFLQPILARHRERIEKGVEEVTEVVGVVGAHAVRNIHRGSVQLLRAGEQWVDKLKAPSPSAGIGHQSASKDVVDEFEAEMASS